MDETITRPRVAASDLNEQLARAAYGAISFEPERRARSDIDGYVTDVNELFDGLLPLATTDRQRTVLVAEVERYAEGYRRHQTAIWSARSRTMSPMITGPSNFPTRRNEKRLGTERRRVEEFLEWRGRARNAVAKAVADARSPEQVADADWQALKKAIDRDLAVVAEIDAGGSPFRRSAFTTSVSGKLERLAANGEADLVRRALDYIRQQQARMPKPFFAERNSVWGLVAQAETKAAAPAPTGEETVAEYVGARVVNNRDAERVQIFFDAKPDEAMRERLKRSGWRWSPSHGAWQRQNTPNGLMNVRHVLAELQPKVPQPVSA